MSSQTYHIGQIFTEAVIKELRSRTNYRIVTENDGTADATLAGMITNVYIAPLTYDSIDRRYFIFHRCGEPAGFLDHP